jgi:hypothetical protein
VNEELIGDPRERGAHHGCELRSLNLPPMGKRWGRGGAGRDERVSSGFGVVSLWVCVFLPLLGSFSAFSLLMMMMELLQNPGFKVFFIKIRSK